MQPVRRGGMDSIIWLLQESNQEILHTNTYLSWCCNACSSRGLLHYDANKNGNKQFLNLTAVKWNAKQKQSTTTSSSCFLISRERGGAEREKKEYETMLCHAQMTRGTAARTNGVTVLFATATNLAVRASSHFNTQRCEAPFLLTICRLIQESDAKNEIIKWQTSWRAIPRRAHQWSMLQTSFWLTHHGQFDWQWRSCQQPNSTTDSFSMGCLETENTTNTDIGCNPQWDR